MRRILFIGDSITDGNHCFTEDNLGTGYVKYLSEQPKMKNDTVFVNGGTDGFTFPRIFKKWEEYYSREDWDYVVITGGINDVSVAAETCRGEEQQEHILQNSLLCLKKMLIQMQEKHIKVILIEPFLFPYPDYRMLWTPYYQKMTAGIQEVLHSFDSCRISLLKIQNRLLILAQQRGFTEITIDGVHLTETGNEFLALMVFKKIEQM